MVLIGTAANLAAYLSQATLEYVGVSPGPDTVAFTLRRYRPTATDATDAKDAKDATKDEGPKGEKKEEGEAPPPKAPGPLPPLGVPRPGKLSGDALEADAAASAATTLSACQRAAAENADAGGYRFCQSNTCAGGAKRGLCELVKAAGPNGSAGESPAFEPAAGFVSAARRPERK